MPSARPFLNLAARLALRAAGRVEPNPLVGCVIVRDGRILGMGHHKVFGGPHAEVEALADCTRRDNDPAAATVYVTLEPCNAHGKQPPCVDALLAARVARVVIARRDPTPTKGGGARRLMDAGVHVEISDESPLATSLSDPFVKRCTTDQPWVIAKWAQTIDGRIATRSGESKWISSELSRRRVHRLRSRVDAILTGIGTALADDPLLTVRTPTPTKSSPRRTPIRVVADTDLDLPLTSRLVRTAHQAPLLIACDRSLVEADITRTKREALAQCGVQLLPVAPVAIGRGLDQRELLAALRARHNVATVLVEAGPGLLGSLFDHDLIDEAIVYIAPLVLGDEQAKAAARGRVAEHLSGARRFNLWRTRPVGNDLEVTYRRPASI